MLNLPNLIEIETPRPPDPILRRPCADREEKRVTHGRDMRNNEQFAAGCLKQKGRPERWDPAAADPIAKRYSNGEHSHAARLQTNG